MLNVTEKERHELAHGLLADNKNDWDGSDPIDKIAGSRFAVVVERSDDSWVLAAATPEAIAEIALSTYTGTEGYDEWIAEVWCMETCEQIDFASVVTVTITLTNGELVTASADNSGD